jgi:hypothetical protein
MPERLDPQVPLVLKDLLVPKVHKVNRASAYS